ncbi:MAG: hypothetical protein ACRC7O_00895 [Fimbriiglobus sp.]
MRVFAGAAIFTGVLIWMWAVLDLLRTQQTSPESTARLSDATLVTLLGTTSITVLGLVNIVARYFFPSPRPHPSTRQKPGHDKPAPNRRRSS